MALSERVNGFSSWLGRAFGFAGWGDRTSMAPYPRYLLFRSAVLGLTGGLAVIAATIALAVLGTSTAWIYGGGAAACLVGLGVGGWVWVRMENARRR